MKEINIRQIKESAVKLIADDWALVTAGNEEKWNTMTVSWGTIGELWGKDVAIIFIRPQRYTKEFLEQEDCFSMKNTARRLRFAAVRAVGSLTRRRRRG